MKRKKINKILKDYILQEKEGSPWLMCETPGEKLAVFAAAEHWKDWENTFASITAAQQEVHVIMRGRWHLLTELVLSEFILSHFLTKEE